LIDEAYALIERLGLQALEGEGGFYRKIYTHRRGSAILGGTIYYLITPDSFSSLHYLPTDELWYFLQGSPLQQLILFPDGRHSLTRLGPVAKDQNPVTIVPGGCYQGTRLLGNEGYALCATTMCPPFDPDKYIQGTKNLMLEYPCCKEVKDFLSGEEL
jgi:predicted cupin superfamily sugar epimerase